MNKQILKHLRELSRHIEYYNNLSPFPVYCTDWLKDVNNKIKEIMENKKEDYDELPVVACKYCKSLHIVTDEVDNNICMRCGSCNEITEFENIHKYNQFKNGENS